MSSPHRTRLAKIDTELPSHSYLKVTDHLTRAQASVLMQLRMGHIPLNAFLNRISKADSPHCPTCQNTAETVHHFLFDCPSHAYVRHDLERTLGCKSKSLRYILGDQEVFRSMLKFVQATGQLKSVYGELSDKSLDTG